MQENMRKGDINIHITFSLAVRYIALALPGSAPDEISLGALAEKGCDRSVKVIGQVTSDTPDLMAGMSGQVNFPQQKN